MRNALATFLDSHAGVTHRDDVGPLLGQVSEIRDHGTFDATSRRWHEAVNVAVSSEAVRDAPRRRAKPRANTARR